MVQITLIERVNHERPRVAEVLYDFKRLFIKMMGGKVL